ncbi:hypothetical protein [Rhizobium sp. BK251]|uniref:hypothetical protein n=1 Tax=Rhizobium sp. BK251 TaxID=2512125 RepID=UPI00104865C9|nr:hypothetical protein [Rhizobium sp. BK251]TCL74876.1 hypothetical protein EV286_102440 [Rhizobium sp. BK251]
MSYISDYPVDEARDLVRNLLTKQLVILEATVSAAATQAESLDGNEREMLRVIWVLMRGIATSTRSVLILTAEFSMGIRDCYGIGRSIFESAVNVAYITAAGPEVALKARRHAMQKAYRNLLREDPAGLNLPRRAPPTPAEDIAGMVEALGEFTQKNGSEITDWAGASVHRKLDAIYSGYPGVQLSMSVAVASIYRDASEILHGTFYGVELFWEQSLDENGSPRNFDDSFVYNHLITLFTAIFGSINGMLEVVGQRYATLKTMELVLPLLKEAAGLLSESYSKH